MKHGTNEGVNCPHCNKPNRNIVEAPINGIKEFQKPCSHCGNLIYYWARNCIWIGAEKPSRVK
jgi:hypothetical protein